jgi:hypothetical protein
MTGSLPVIAFVQLLNQTDPIVRCDNVHALTAIFGNTMFRFD